MLLDFMDSILSLCKVVFKPLDILIFLVNFVLKNEIVLIGWHHYLGLRATLLG